MLSNSWNISFEIRNQTRSSNVISRSFTNYVARNGHLDNGTVQWRNYDGVSNAPTMLPHPGFSLFITPTPLERSAFAIHRDTDNDGMPDGWETSNSFNPVSAHDATSDADSDDLINRDEYLAGTQPRNRDTDGDGVPDGLERSLSTDPRVSSSRPPRGHGMAAGRGPGWKRASGHRKLGTAPFIWCRVMMPMGMVYPTVTKPTFMDRSAGCGLGVGGFL